MCEEMKSSLWVRVSVMTFAWNLRGGRLCTVVPKVMSFCIHYCSKLLLHSMSLWYSAVLTSYLNMLLSCRDKVLFEISSSQAARSSVVGWGIMLQARRLRVRIPDEVIRFFNLPNPFSRTMTLGSTQTLTEISTRNLPSTKGLPARKADNLTAICEPIV
jgi:hypothetical protein